MADQLDLFAPGPPPSPAALREEERFGLWDAKCGLPLRNRYSDRLPEERLAAYERGFRAERARMCGDG